MLVFVNYAHYSKTCRNYAEITKDIENIGKISTSSPGLFPPHPFFKGKALGTRLVKYIYISDCKISLASFV